MFVFKHAILNIGRHIWNYLLVGIILFLLILGTIVTNTIYTSAKLFANNYSKQFTTLVTILEPGLRNSTHEEKLTKEQYLKFGESDYVKGMNIVGNIPVSFEELKTIENKTPTQLDLSENILLEKDFFQATASLFGIEPTQMAKELAGNQMEIYKGTSNLKLDEGLISKELAKLNQLQIGDSIQVLITENEKIEKKKLTIAGIYQPRNDIKPSDSSQMMMIQGNDIFASWETLQTMETFKHIGDKNASYELKSKDNFHEFVKEMQGKGLPNDYQVITNETSMEILLNPVNGMGTMSGTILLGFLIFGDFSLIILSIWKFRQTQTEICVLRNSGITKKLLIQSKVIEWLLVSGVCFSLALLSAIFIVQPLADGQLMYQQQLAGNLNQLFIAVYSGESETINSIPMIMNGASIVRLLAITSLFWMTIVSIDSYKIFKFEPIEFLLERNIDE